MSKELIIYCDESDSQGNFFSNFYGGALVSSSDLELVVCALEDKKAALHIFGEAKWTKVSENYLDKYTELIDAFFDLIAAGHVKVRIMFTQNTHRAVGLTSEQKSNEFFLLYYQFVKHAFGLRYCNPEGQPTKLRIYFDWLPQKKEKCSQFKGYIHNLSKTEIFREAKITIPEDQIAEVDSHKHVILQCFDIVLGAMTFRLNDKHLEKPEGARRRGKKTLAKLRLFKHIQKRIMEILPGFNIGTSTGWRGGVENIWVHPYRHWLFIPSESEYDPSKGKRKKQTPLSLGLSAHSQVGT